MLAQLHGQGDTKFQIMMDNCLSTEAACNLIPQAGVMMSAITGAASTGYLHITLCRQHLGFLTEEHQAQAQDRASSSRQSIKLNRGHEEEDEQLACNGGEARLSVARLGMALTITNPQRSKRR